MRFLFGRGVPAMKTTEPEGNFFPISRAVTNHWGMLTNAAKVLYVELCSRRNIFAESECGTFWARDGGVLGLQDVLRVSSATLKRARKELLKHGLIRTIPGRNGHATVYQVANAFMAGGQK